MLGSALRSYCHSHKHPPDLNGLHQHFFPQRYMRAVAVTGGFCWAWLHAVLQSGTQAQEQTLSGEFCSSGEGQKQRVEPRKRTEAFVQTCLVYYLRPLHWPEQVWWLLPEYVGQSICTHRKAEQGWAGNNNKIYHGISRWLTSHFSCSLYLWEVLIFPSFTIVLMGLWERQR